ncbi:MAG: hypothetical protein GEV10_00330 [Streptosporangiales bacterium]|nr:hypothetical protein [Streptosporangiales bacterium]
MSDPVLLVERRDRAAVLTLNRPRKRNALSAELLDALTAELERLVADDTVSGVVLTGGPSCFSAGADLNEAVDITTVTAFRTFAERAARLNRVIEEHPKPVLAAVSGPCLTGGLELALACDYRLSSPDATFGITSARIGSVAGFGGTQRLPRLIGPSRAKEMLFTARIVAADEAASLGLVDRVMPHDELLAAALALVADIAKVGPLSVALMKRAVNTGLETDLRSGLELEQALSGWAFTTHDKQEGMRAFLEKRQARFTGR